MKFALIAHDGKKADMVGFVMKRLSFFKRDDVELVGTGTTGGIIENAGLRKRFQLFALFRKPTTDFKARLLLF